MLEQYAKGKGLHFLEGKITIHKGDMKVIVMQSGPYYVANGYIALNLDVQLTKKISVNGATHTQLDTMIDHIFHWL